jgi:SlyX protein
MLNSETNAPDQFSEHTDSRLMKLEIKASFAEDLLEQLNTTVYRQQQEIDRLSRAVGQLILQTQEGGPREGGSVADELPPHY